MLNTPIQNGRPPWLVEDLNGTLQSKLDQEMAQLVYFLSPKNHQKRSSIFALLSKKLADLGYNCSVFGSCGTGLYLDYSDIDVVILVDLDFVNANQMKRILKKVYRVCQHFDEFEFISRAKIPILKFSIDSIPIDLSVNSKIGSIEYTKHCARILTSVPMVGKLLIVLKQFLRCRGLESNASGGVGGYFLFLWILSFLQFRYPHKYSNNLVEEDSKLNQDGIGIELPFSCTNVEGGGLEFFEFMHHFSSEYDYSRSKLSPCTKSVLDDRCQVQFKKGLRLIIIDPLNNDNALELPADRILLLVEHFKYCCRTLASNGRNDSLLARILKIEEPVKTKVVKKAKQPAFRNREKPKTGGLSSSRFNGKKHKTNKNLMELQSSNRDGNHKDLLKGFKDSFGVKKKRFERKNISVNVKKRKN